MGTHPSRQDLVTCRRNSELPAHAQHLNSDVSARPLLKKGPDWRKDCGRLQQAVLTDQNPTVCREIRVRMDLAQRYARSGVPDAARRSSAGSAVAWCGSCRGTDPCSSMRRG
jgi:hypothetical protein